MSGIFVYRCYDAGGQLLYIGSTGRGQSRFLIHQSQTPWWSRVAEIKTEEFPTLPEARAAEKTAIRTENPLLNKRRYKTDTPRRAPSLIRQHRGRLRRYRYIAGLTIEQLAAQVGCSSSWLSAIESYSSPACASVGLLERVATALGREVSDLLRTEAEQKAAA